MLPALDSIDLLRSVVTVNIIRWPAPARNTRI
jgi:hypothetical protein